MGLSCKCHNCEKDFSKFIETKTASDGNIYCLNCFKELNLESKKSNKSFSLVSIFLKVLSIFYLIDALFSNISYDGDLMRESYMLSGITISVFLWALGVIVQKVCIIADNSSK